MHIFKMMQSDLKRMLTGYRVYLAICGVVLAYIFSRENTGIENNSVLLTFVSSTMLSGSLITYIFCAFPFAQVFCEDIENKYLHYELIRGGLKRYVFVKTIIIFFSSIAVMVIGSLLFILLLRTQGPMVDEKMGVDSFLLGGAYSDLLEREHYIWYCIIYAFQLGMLAGVLSVMSAFLSLYISNRVMVLVLPVFITQVLVDFKTNQYGFGILSYRAYIRRFDEDWKYLFFLVFMSLVIIFFIACGIYRKVEKRI